MVTCLVDKENVTRFPRAERLPTRTVLADEEFRYDEHFWEDFNIIPLEEELSKIIEKVALKIEKQVLRRNRISRIIVILQPESISIKDGIT